jgi:hypothetical protein
MSADNGIYIAHFADGEIRVAHATAIDNCYYPNGENATEIVNYFQDAYMADGPMDAGRKAFEMEEKILADDLFPILEYGICRIDFKKSFGEYVRESTGLNSSPSIW